MTCEVVDVLEDGNRRIHFNYEGIFFNLLDQIGQMPLPPYIKEKLEDRERYQTVYSKETGSAAAPTAGLHFTPQLLERIQQKGIQLGFVTLHVGLGSTFRPVSEDKIQNHKMHSEHYYMPQATADLINETKKEWKTCNRRGNYQLPDHRVGSSKEGRFCESEGWTDIFIYPGFEFRGPRWTDH